MVEIELTFNPYKLQTQMKVQGKKAPQELVERICSPDGVDMASWSVNFFSRAVNHFNDNVDVTFNGLLRDYEFLEDSLNSFSETGSRLKKGKIATPEDRLQKLKELFAKMQRETPFEILRSDQLKRLFDRATNAEFEMAAVATVSSGKSTIINAILGEELLPARNEATTATIARIHDVDGRVGFCAASYDANGNLLAKWDPLTLSSMEELNANSAVTVVEISGKVPGITTKALKLVLTDTPGPNNSRTTEHHAHTYRLLKDDFKPMILYILNATQLEINDDEALLRDVAEAMKTGGRQSRDRFLFVLNKVDELDRDHGETTPKTIDNVKKYLARLGITDARIFPTAARMAKVLRQDLAGLTLTQKEEDEILPQYPNYVKREWRHLSDFAPLSTSCRKIQDKMIADAQSAGDERRLALVYTGIPAVELAITEYIEKYALPAKIAKGVESFKAKVASLKIEADTKEIIAGDEKKLNELQRAIRELEKILKNTDMAKGVRDAIEALNVDNEIKSALAHSGEELARSLRTHVTGMCKKVRASEARKFVDDLKGAVIPRVQANFISTIEKALDGVLRSQAQQCIDGYKNYVEAFLGKVECPELVKIVLKPDEISIDEAIDDFVFEEDVIVGSHYENEESDFFSGKSLRSKFASWLGVDSFLGKKAQVEVNDWERQDFVEFSEYIEKNLYPAVENFDKHTRKIATDWVRAQVKSFKQTFVRRLSSLDETIKKKVREQKEILDNAEKKEQAIATNKRNLVWLNEFIRELDGIIAV